MAGQTVEESIKAAYEKSGLDFDEDETSLDEEINKAREKDDEDEVEEEEEIEEEEKSEEEVEDDQAESENSEEVEGDEEEDSGEVEDLAAPNFLDAEERAEFDNLAPEAKQLYDRMSRRRDLAYQRYVSRTQRQAQEQVQQAAAPYQGLEQAIQPHMESLKLRKQDLAQAVSYGLAWNERIEQHPIAGLAQLCAQKNIHPRALFEFMQDPQNSNIVYNGSLPTSEANPEVEGLRQEIAELKRATGADLSPEESQLLQIADSAPHATDQEGNRLFPYWEELRQETAAFVRIMGAQYPNLSPQELIMQAYRRAEASHPHTARLAKQAFDAAKPKGKGKKVVKKVSASRKKARGSISTSSSGGGKGKDTSGSEDAPLSVTESLVKAMDDAGIDMDSL